MANKYIMFHILEWQQGDSTALTYMADMYVQRWVRISDSGREEIINGDAFRYFARNGWEPLSVNQIRVGHLWWKKEVNYWVFIKTV